VVPDGANDANARAEPGVDARAAAVREDDLLRGGPTQASIRGGGGVARVLTSACAVLLGVCALSLPPSLSLSVCLCVCVCVCWDAQNSALEIRGPGTNSQK
jgi:hypothetical protein